MISKSAELPNLTEVAILPNLPNRTEYSVAHYKLCSKSKIHYFESFSKSWTKNDDFEQCEYQALADTLENGSLG